MGCAFRGVVKLLFLLSVIRHVRHHLMYAERNDMRTHLTVHLVHAAGTVRDDRTVIQHFERYLHRVSGGSRNLSGYHMVDIIPFGMKHASLLRKVKRLVEHIPSAPANEDVICEIRRCHRRTTFSVDEKGRNNVAAPSSTVAIGLGLGCERDESLEAGRVVDRDFGKHLAVQHHACVDEASHELGVADALCTGGGADASNPELTEVTLLQLAVDRRKAAGAIDGLSRLTEILAARTAETLGEFQAAATAFAGSGCVGCT